MTALERMQLAFQHKEAEDRVPLWGHIFNIEFIEKITGKKLKDASFEEKERIVAEAHIKAGIDVLPGICVPRWGTFKVKEKEFEYEYISNGYTGGIIGGDKKCTLEQAVEYVKRQINQDYSELSPMLDINAVNRWQTLVGDRIVIVPTFEFLVPYGEIGLENFSVMMYDYPTLIEDYIEVRLNRVLKTIDIISFCSKSI